ncbi:MAG: N-acetylglucosamine-6-phosphate deacetylase [Imperialibacter sp.]|uniref:N-acetylglucosamine-6-phosphate deacetylase n=1 Tax=Imperialibacter sp. TaxID=2038411 RepID=UPI003A84996E
MKEASFIEAIDCLNGRHVTVNAASGISALSKSCSVSDQVLFVGPGLVDLQVNGVNGIDFNNTSLNGEDLLKATKFLLSHGVTTFFPTIITNSDENICQLLATINEACRQHDLLRQCIGGIHLEGPFISKEEGARGAHDKKYVKAPNWELFMRFQKAAGNRIKMITLSPEWDNSAAFISSAVKSRVLVSIGHSLASPEQIQKAVDAGATMSTHIGNAVPLMLPRHPNIIWEQLAQDALSCSFIADGFHLPNSFMKVVIKAKGNNCFLVSDSTSFTGMKPGVYNTHIGGQVKLEANGRLSMESGNGLLAGAAMTLLQNVEYLVTHQVASLSQAWKMASVIPDSLMNTYREPNKILWEDAVIFSFEEKIAIQKVYKCGGLAFEG